MLTVASPNMSHSHGRNTSISSHSSHCAMTPLGQDGRALSPLVMVSQRQIRPRTAFSLSHVQARSVSAAAARLTGRVTATTRPPAGHVPSPSAVPELQPQAAIGTSGWHAHNPARAVRHDAGCRWLRQFPAGFPWGGHRSRRLLPAVQTCPSEIREASKPATRQHPIRAATRRRHIRFPAIPLGREAQNVEPALRMGGHDAARSG